MGDTLGMGFRDVLVHSPAFHRHCPPSGGSPALSPFLKEARALLELTDCCEVTSVTVGTPKLLSRLGALICLSGLWYRLQDSKNSEHRPRGEAGIKSPQIHRCG